MRISSTANSRLRDIRKLRNRKEREASGTFFLEGIRIVTEAIEQGADILELIVAPELLSSSFAQSVIIQFQQNGGQVFEVGKEAFTSLALKENPQGLAAVSRQRWMRLDEIRMHESDIWVVLDSVRDPGNLGTILRTVDAVDGVGVILLDDSCDPYDPTAIRASMGAIFTRQLIKTSLSIFSDWKTKNKAFAVGTSDHAGRVHYRDMKYPGSMILMMGSERAGLSQEHIALCDVMVHIPMSGACDSLNLSVATGIILYEIYDQLHGREERK